MFCVNARSIVNKTDKLEEILLLYCPDLVLITKTWLHSGVQDSEIVPSKYFFVGSDRDGRGGGVAIAAKQGITFAQEPGIDNHESVWCTVTSPRGSMLIGGVYRKPGAPDDYLQQLYDFLHAKVNQRTKIIPTGDFNLPDIDWSTLKTGSRENSSCELLLNIMLAFSLSQLEKEPTRVQDHSRSTLDLVFVSHNLEPELSIEDGISEHTMLFLKK